MSLILEFVGYSMEVELLKGVCMVMIPCKNKRSMLMCNNICGIKIIGLAWCFMLIVILKQSIMYIICRLSIQPFYCMPAGPSKPRS